MVAACSQMSACENLWKKQNEQEKKKELWHTQKLPIVLDKQNPINPYVIGRVQVHDEIWEDGEELSFGELHLESIQKSYSIDL